MPTQHPRPLPAGAARAGGGAMPQGRGGVSGRCTGSRRGGAALWGTDTDQRKGRRGAQGSVQRGGFPGKQRAGSPFPGRGGTCERERVLRGQASYHRTRKSAKNRAARGRDFRRGAPGGDSRWRGRPSECERGRAGSGAARGCGKRRGALAMLEGIGLSRRRRDPGEWGAGPVVVVVVLDVATSGCKHAPLLELPCLCFSP